MKQFKDFGITSTTKSFTGDKVNINRVINRKITVHDYKIEKSKFEKGNGKCLHLQIELSGTKNVVFTSGSYLMSALEQIGRDNLPFETTIIEIDKHLEFS